MKEQIEKIKQIFSLENFIRYREANDSIVIDSLYTDPYANDHSIGIMIYKDDDGRLRIDDIRMIDEIIDVNDVDLSNPIHKKVYDMLINTFSFKVEDRHVYRYLYDIDSDYKSVMENNKMHSRIVEEVITFFSGIMAFTKITEFIKLYSDISN